MFGNLFLRVILAVLIGTLLLFAVYCIPTEEMNSNLGTAHYLAAEGVYPRLTPYASSQLDNWTDAVMLMNASYDGKESVITKAMLVPRHQITDKQNTYESLIGHYTNGEAFDSQTTYPRYWHGYLVLLKPLLYITSYQRIRQINGVIQLSLLLLNVFLLYRRDLKRIIPPYIIIYLFLMPLALARSLQFSTCYYLYTLSCTAMLLFPNQLKHKDAVFFLYIGIATSFFDFLTYPIATIGIPAVLYFCITGYESVASAFRRGFRICFSWFFGYVGMWAGKWLICTILTGNSIFLNTFNAIATRTSSSPETGLTLSAAYSKNISSFFHTPATLLFFLFFGFLLLQIVGHRKYGKLSNILLTAVFPYIILALFPFLWYFFTINHSCIHFWFTNKALSVTIFSSMCALIQAKHTILTSTLC